MRAAAIITAAGSGERMGSAVKKPYLLLAGKPLLAYTLQAFAAACGIVQIIVTISPGDENYCRESVIAGSCIKIPVSIVAGGLRRQDSVRNGLACVAPDTDLVMIHDAARPFITAAIIETALSQTAGKNATTLAVPVKDTIALVEKSSGCIERTLQRDRLYMIQTPQTFKREIICEAHRRAQAEGFAGTDDASLVERMGVPISIIAGSYENLKITTPEDMVFAEATLQKRQALG